MHKGKMFAAASLTAVFTATSSISPVMPASICDHTRIGAWFSGKLIDTSLQMDSVSRRISSDVMRARGLARVKRMLAPQDDGEQLVSLKAAQVAMNLMLALSQPPEVYPTGRQTVQMQYELADDSYMEMEVFPQKIEVMQIPYGDVSRVRYATVPAEHYYQLIDLAGQFLGA